MLTGQELAEVKNERSQATKEWIAKAKEYVPRGVSIVNEVIAEEAKGAVIRDIDGNTYLDFYAGVGVINGGHCPKEVVDAIQAQAGKFLHTFFHQFPHRPYIELSEKLSQLAPGSGPKKAAFFNSGSEAVENVVKIARRYTGRTPIIAFDGSFHGRTLLTMSLTSKVKPYRYKCGPFAPEVYKLGSAYCYRCPWNSSHPGCGMHCLEQFKPFFKSEVDAGEVAAMIIEPVQGEGGFVVQPKEFLQGLKAICQEHGIVFAVDEVQSGFYRTGTPFAVSQAGVEPDLMSCAKSIAAGMPLGAVVGKAEIMDGPDSGQLGGTYSGNPVACAAANAALDYYRTQDLGARARWIHDVVMRKLHDMQERYPAIGDVRGLGAMIGIEFVKDRSTKEPDRASVDRITAECFKRGLIVLSAGTFGNVIRMLMPLVITPEQLDQALAIFDASCAVVLT
ncbi:MAG TPA: 4-aminobutyrate--2-oxoglutarate transaminase [Holophaga sp.]|nr:4-aminobutyrate--2-oxoglutarate transaminase [Holophaga sp.]